MKKSELRQLIKEEITRSLMENNMLDREAENAYREAYEYETGKEFFTHRFEFDDAKKLEIIKIQGLVSNDEDLGDVTLIKSPSGWRLQ